MKQFRFFLPLVILTFAAACSGNKKDDAVPEAKNEKPKVFKSFEERVKYEIEERLGIPKNEKYSLKIYKELIDNDNVEDAIITVNRASFAQKEAIRTNTVKKMAETDFSGYFNAFLYYNGGTDEFGTKVFRIGSSPARELDVKFENITSKGARDICISYRIKNSGFKKFYTITPAHQPELIFEWEWFKNAGEESQQGILYEIANDISPVSKDFFLYESVIDNNDEAKADAYKFEPVITKKGKLIYHFFYDPNYFKYRGIPNE